MVEGFETKLQKVNVQDEQSRGFASMKTSREVIVHTFMHHTLSAQWAVYTIYRYLGQKYLFVSANDVAVMDSKI